MHKDIAPIFRIHGKYYYFDTGSNQVLIVDKVTAILLENSPNFISNGDIVIPQKYKKYKEFKKRCAQLVLKKHQGNYFQKNKFIYSDKKEVQLAPTTIEFIFSEKCNLHCNYCGSRGKYGRKSNIRISWENIENTINFVSNNFKHESLIIKFFGGEPLINFSLIKRIIQSFNNKGIKTQNVISTNGILINDNILDYLVENDFLVFISLDGPPNIHNLYRKDFKGRNTYEVVREKLIRIKSYNSQWFHTNVAINSVITPENCSKLEEIVSHIKSIGVNPQNIILNDVSPTNDPSTIYEDEQIESIKKIKRDLRQRIINNPDLDECFKSYVNYKQNSIIKNNFSPSSSDKEVKEKDIRMTDCLTSGWSTVSIFPNGELSCCLDFPYLPELVFGSKGGLTLNLSKINKFRNDFRRSIETGSCSKCWAARYCQYISCYKLFAKSGCDINWQNGNLCKEIRGDLKERMYDYLKTKVSI